MFEPKRLHRLRKAPDIGFVYDEGNMSDHDFKARADGKKGFAKAYVEGRIRGKLVEFVEVRGSKVFPPINVVVMSTLEYIDSINERLVFSGIKEPYYTDYSDISAWMVGDSPKDEFFIPMFIMRTDIEDGNERINRFFEGFVEDIKEELYGTAS